MRISINARPPGMHLPRNSRVTCTVCWGSLKIVKIRVISSTPCWNTLLIKKIRIANLYFVYWPPGCVTPAAPQTPNGIHYLPNHIRHTRELFGLNDTFVIPRVCSSHGLLHVICRQSVWVNTEHPKGPPPPRPAVYHSVLAPLSHTNVYHMLYTKSSV